MPMTHVIPMTTSRETEDINQYLHVRERTKKRWRKEEEEEEERWRQPSNELDDKFAISMQLT